MSWASETRRLTKLRWQIYRLEKQGFADFPDIEDLRTTKDKIKALEEAKANAVKEIRANIINPTARKGGDADLRIKAALAELEGKDLKALKQILADIKKAKDDGESTEELYSSLWASMDSGTVATNTIENSNTPF